MTDLDLIKKFREIQITKICKNVGVDYANLISGRASEEATNKVKEELVKLLNNLLRDEEGETSAR